MTSSLVTPTTSTVLIQGETGTGKELVAKASMHARSDSGRAASGYIGPGDYV